VVGYIQQSYFAQVNIRRSILIGLKINIQVVFKMNNPQLSRKEEISNRIEKFKRENEDVLERWEANEVYEDDEIDDLVNYFKDKARLDERIRAEQDFLKMIENLKKRIMINGNLSNRIISLGDEEFEFKHDYILNNIVCEVIDEELKSTIKQEKTE